MVGRTFHLRHAASEWFDVGQIFCGPLLREGAAVTSAPGGGDKHSRGRVLIIAGSVEVRGAALLAACALAGICPRYFSDGAIRHVCLRIDSKYLRLVQIFQQVPHAKDSHLVGHDQHAMSDVVKHTSEPQNEVAPAFTSGGLK